MIYVGKVIPPDPQGTVWEFWGVDEKDVTCAFLSAYYYAASKVFIFLGIEVRPGWRGQDYGYIFYLAVQAKMRVPMIGEA